MFLAGAEGKKPANAKDPCRSACPPHPTALFSTAGMVVLQQDPEGMYLIEQRPRQPVAVAGVLFLLLSLLPLVSEGSVTALRLATAVALGLGAALCFVVGLPRPRRLPLPEPSAAQRLVLTGTSNIEGYAVDAVAASGARRRLLSGADPGRVLADSLALSSALGAPLEPGWGLDRKALGVLCHPARAPLLVQPFVIKHRIIPDQAIGAGTALWAGAFIPLATLVLALSPARPNLGPTTLALVLPALTSLYALAVGVWLFGLKETLTLERGQLTRRRFWFDHALGPNVETQDVVALHGVAPLGGSTRHLLAATRTGPVAFPSEPRVGEALSRYPGEELPLAGRAAE
jgi:hypothetical protein